MYLASLKDGEKVSIAIQCDDKRISVITGAGATATISRVNGAEASEHIAGVGQYTVAAVALDSIEVDWPYYHVSVAGGTCRVAVI